MSDELLVVFFACLVIGTAFVVLLHQAGNENPDMWDAFDLGDDFGQQFTNGLLVIPRCLLAVPRCVLWLVDAEETAIADFEQHIANTLLVIPRCLLWLVDAEEVKPHRSCGWDHWLRRYSCWDVTGSLIPGPYSCRVNASTFETLPDW